MPVTPSGLRYRVNRRMDGTGATQQRIPHSITIYCPDLYADGLDELFFELDKLGMRHGEIAENKKSLNMRLYPIHP